MQLMDELGGAIMICLTTRRRVWVNANAIRPIRWNLSTLSFQRNNNIFFSQQISISISISIGRFSGQLNRAFI